MRRYAAAITLAVLCSAVGSEGASAGATTERTRIPGAELSLEYPSHWVDVPLPSAPQRIKSVREYLKGNPKLAEVFSVDPNASDAEIRWFRKDTLPYITLARVDPETGDNVNVNIAPGEWWTGLREFKEIGKALASARNAETFTDAKTSVGRRPAFTHLEHDGDRIHAYMDIKHRNGAVVTLNVTTHDAAVAQAILDSVQPVARSK